jgi:MFS family permease
VAATKTTLQDMFRALSSANYRLFFIGQSVSLIGTWMQTVAMSWLVYRLSHSAVLLGVLGFVTDIPGFLLMPFAGVIADRLDRRRIVMATQLLAMAQACALSALVLTEGVRIWHLIALSTFLGCVTAFDLPTRQAFVVELVATKEHIPNAIALNSTIFNLARLLGPSAAGLLISAAGEGACFLINAASYGAVIAALVLIRRPEAPTRTSTKETSPLSALRQGLSYSYRFLPIRNILMLTALVSTVGLPYTVLMPIIAGTVLDGGSRTLGFLMGAGGAGALAGALAMASRKTVLGLGKTIPAAAGLFSGGLLVLALSRNVLLSAAAMLVMGFGLITQLAASNTLLQTLVDEDKRGRVMGIYTMAVRGMVPLGSLVTGYVAVVVGPSTALAAGGTLCAAGALMFRSRLPKMREIVRPIYLREGIIRDIEQPLG